MARLRDLGQVVVAFGQKTVGVGLEFAGALVGNSRLQDTGRQLESAANDNLEAVEEEKNAEIALTRLQSVSRRT